MLVTNMELCIYVGNTLLNMAYFQQLLECHEILMRWLYTTSVHCKGQRKIYDFTTALGIYVVAVDYKVNMYCYYYTTRVPSTL